MKIETLDDLSVDAAFVIALPAIFQQGLQYGRDIIFTYGPWGMLADNIAPWNYYFIIVGLRIFLLISVCLVIERIFSERDDASALNVLKASILLALILLWLMGIDQSFWFLPTLFVGLYYIAHLQDASENAGLFWLSVFAVICSGFAGMVKFNVFVLSAVIQLILLIACLWRRRVPYLPIIWIGSTTLFWALAGQGMGNLTRWVTLSLDLSAGYADAMSIGFMTRYSVLELILVVLGIMAFVAFAAVVAAAVKQLPERVALFGVAMLAAGLAWQHIVGGNQIEQGVGEILAAILIGLAVYRDPATRWNSARVKFWTALLSVVFLGAAALSATPLNVHDLVLGRLRGKLSGLVALVQHGFSDQRHAWDDLLASIRRSAPMPPDLQGTADIYPQHTGVVIADPRLTYDPRPAYLSLNAHTLKLAMLNAEHLRTDPPQNVLFQVLPRRLSVNNRHPATADGPSWPELLTRYDPSEQAADFLVLKRRAQPLPYRFGHTETHAVPWNEPLAINGSPHTLIWAQLRVHPSILGRLVKLLYKSPDVALEETFADGQSREYQIVPALGEAGFLLSPLVDDTPSFLKLMQNTEPLATRHRTVTSIKVKTSRGASWLWSKNVEITLSDLNIDDGRARSVPMNLADELLAGDLIQNSIGCSPSDESAPGLIGRIVLLHAPCLTTLAAPEDSDGVVITYGLRYVPKNGGPDTDGADFTLQALGPGGQLSAMSRFLDPAKRAEDRGEQNATLSWSPGTVTSVKLEFGNGPAGDRVYDHTYVSRVRFLRNPH